MRNKWKLENKVDMIRKMPPSELKKYTPLAHLGFSLDGFTDTNFLYNLPNKIFDYIHAGVPVIATEIPEVKAIVEEYQCGVCTKSQEPIEIAEQVKSIMNNNEYYQRLRQNALIAAKELCWENEKSKIVDIYQSYL
jgi:glycosyltransferase involved in cell wall biosynthesis